MKRHYDLPTLPQYVFNRQRAEYEYYSQTHKPKLQVLNPHRPSLRPLENPSLLGDQIFGSYLDTGAAYWSFISDQAAVEKSQLQILLDQLVARHAIASEVRDNLDRRDMMISSQLSAVEGGAFGYADPLGLKQRLEGRLEEVDRERNMEGVNLWRDSQKLLGDLFRHWSAYANLARRSRVIDNDV